MANIGSTDFRRIFPRSKRNGPLLTFFATVLTAISIYTTRTTVFALQRYSIVVSFQAEARYPSRGATLGLLRVASQTSHFTTCSESLHVYSLNSQPTVVPYFLVVAAVFLAFLALLLSAIPRHHTFPQYYVSFSSYLLLHDFFLSFPWLNKHYLMCDSVSLRLYTKCSP